MVKPWQVPSRWQDYVLYRGEGLREFWQAHLADTRRSVCVILAKGFDPRMCLGIEMLAECATGVSLDVKCIEFDEGPTSPSLVHRQLVQQNWQDLITLTKTGLPPEIRPIQMLNEGRRVGSRNAADTFQSLADFGGCTDLVVDVSAMPRTIYCPLISKLLFLVDEARASGAKEVPNLHLVVGENPKLDACIADEEVDDTASYVVPYSSRLDREATAGRPRVWIPLLGEGQELQLARINDLVAPDEVCPVLPSPSVDPRRGDDLILAYRGLLFDTFRIEPRNIIYASEWNPFEVYRQVRQTMMHYQEALAALDGCKTVLSALSSKLMSLGALLVAYEAKDLGLDIGMAHVECRGSVMDLAKAQAVRSSGELVGMWVSGECYE